jgi:hypothetical protein
MNRKSELVPTVKCRKQRRAPAAALGASLLATVLGMLLWAAPGASAADTIYWDNYQGGTIGFANLDGSGGGQLDTGGQEVVEPEGMAIDSVTGRLYWTNYTGGPGGTGAIRYANLDGSGGGELDTGGAEVDEPNGVAIDPATRTIYWANYGGGPSGEGSISFANLDGGGSGQLNSGGATLEYPIRIAIDPAANRIYWANNPGPINSISYAALGNSGAGGDLDLSGATAPEYITGLAVDRAGGRIYWIDEDNENISYANLGGGGGGDLNIAGAPFEDPFGMALDPATGRVYWGNYGNDEERLGAFGYAALSGGGGGGIDIASAPVNGPQDPVILKPPSGVVPPSAVAVKTLAGRGLLLSCSQGVWAGDLPGSYVYRAPRTYAYQWTLNGAPIGGATSSSHLAALPGAYRCAVTASNQNGSATQTSAPFQVAGPPPPPPARLKVAVRPGKARARAGKKAARFKVWVTNFGGLPATGVRVCVRKPQKPKKAKRRARKALKAPKCRKLGTIAPGATRSKVRVNVWARRRARGTYRLRFVLRGGGGAKPVTRKLVAKKHKKKRHRKGK